jgi:DNA-3-methyladenine glycosylase I
MLAYHDGEWGVPCHDDRALFELMTLEGAQAGLSWNTILNKRANYRRAFENFDIERVAAYTDADIARLLGDAGIVRNRLKIASTVSNAAAILRLVEEFGSFDAYIWRFVGGAPKVNSPADLRDIPASSPESDVLSKDLRKRGFRFVGATICYAFMQAAGLVDDHELGCFRHGTRSP